MKTFILMVICVRVVFKGKDIDKKQLDFTEKFYGEVLELAKDCVFVKKIIIETNWKANEYMKDSTVNIFFSQITSYCNIKYIIILIHYNKYLENEWNFEEKKFDYL